MLANYYAGDDRPVISTKGSHGGHGATFGNNNSAVAVNRSGSALDYANSISDYMDQFNVAQTNMVNSFNAKEAQKNRDWQERMARNAHQYEVEDLIKAGLNPVLSAGGQGAFVGSGAVASGQKAVADNTRAQAAMALLNNALYSSGQVAAASAKAAGDAGNSKAATSTWKDYANMALKVAGITVAGARTFGIFSQMRNSAKAAAAAAQMIGGSVAYQTFTKKGVNTKYKYY